MLIRILFAVGVGIVAWLICQFAGVVLVAIGIDWVKAVGDFLKLYAGLVSLVAAIFAFVKGHPRFGVAPLV